MMEMTRRQFLVRSGLAAGAVAAYSSAPGVASAILSEAEPAVKALPFEEAISWRADRNVFQYHASMIIKGERYDWSNLFDEKSEKALAWNRHIATLAFRREGA